MQELKPQNDSIGSNIIQGNLLVFGAAYLPYDFLTWRECCNFLIEKCYGLKRAMKLMKRESGRLEMRCPLTGEWLTVLGSQEDCEHIYRTFILQNLWYQQRHS